MDLPFALPTSVAGLTLATVYGEEGILGRFLINMGVNVVYTRLGVAVAMIFVSFPFVVRTMQPVLQVRRGLQDGVCDVLQGLQIRGLLAAGHSAVHVSVASARGRCALSGL